MTGLEMSQSVVSLQAVFAALQGDTLIFVKSMSGLNANVLPWSQIKGMTRGMGVL